MSIEANKSIAIKFVTTMRERRGFDENMVSDDLKWWSPSVGTMDKKTLLNLLVDVRKRMPTFPEMKVVGVTAEGDRVALEVEGRCALPDSRRYDNTYHFLFRIIDGRIREVREYTDTLTVARTFGGVPS